MSVMTGKSTTLCNNGLKHVFVKETRPSKVNSTFARIKPDCIDERVVCQRCGTVAPGLDWDGPFEPAVLTEETG